MPLEPEQAARRPGSLPADEGQPTALARFWQWLERGRFGRRLVALREYLHPLVTLLDIPVPDTPRLLQRLEFMERDIVLPIKAAAMAMLFQSFYFTPWINEATSALELPLEYTQYFFWIYFLLNAVYACLIFVMRRVPLGLLQWAVFAASLLDGIFMGALTLVTGGYNSLLYWLFLGLIVRASVSVPRATSQLLLNLTLSACYVLAGMVDLSIAKSLTVTEQRALEIYSADNPAEPLLLRLALLLMMTLGCYALQVLLERQRRAEEEAREFALREVQLRSVGRLAAEFAHQIKNPLAIINNAAFSLQRTLRGDKAETIELVEMIKEEIDRADRIITEVMGYAQLSEGHVEKLDVKEELDKALDRVFPKAARFPVEVRRNFGHHLPPLLMQRRHAAEAFVNVLQNAREALGDAGGAVEVHAQALPDASIRVAIQDNGPGIPPDKQERIFEAYYTTKEKGTGLGLATVKHNVELYGGTVRVESELGKGARFVLVFPAKTSMKLDKKS